MKPIHKIFSIATLTVFAAIAAGAATAAETQWEKNHPRRTEVNARLAHQNQRIDKQLKEGDITQQQAKALHKEDHQIRQEERDMASQNNGHITKQEQRTLNQQENAVSKEIGH